MECNNEITDIIIATILQHTLLQSQEEDYCHHSVEGGEEEEDYCHHSVEGGEEKEDYCHHHVEGGEEQLPCQ